MVPIGWHLSHPMGGLVPIVWLQHDMIILGVCHNPQGRVALIRSFLQPIGWLWGHPMGTEHREWSGENNECEYAYDLSSKQNKKLLWVVTHLWESESTCLLVRKLADPSPCGSTSMLILYKNPASSCPRGMLPGDRRSSPVPPLQGCR